MSITPRFYTRGLLAAVLAAGLAACGGGGDEGNSTSGPIKIGAVSGLTGGAVFPEASETVQAYFDRVNDAGGVNGRKIEYIVEDDKGDPAVASQAARKLVDNEKVVVLTGSASALECSVNTKYYETRDIRSVQGIGVDPACYSSKNISPVNGGPFAGITAGLNFASNTLGATKVCSFMNTFPGWGPAQDDAVAVWEKNSGLEMTYYQRDLTTEDDLTPYVLAAKDAGCEAVYAFGLDFQAIATMKAVEQQDAGDMAWIFSSGAYTSQVAEALGATGEGMYATSEFEPFTGDGGGEDTADMRSLLEENDIPLTSFAQGGYLSAKVIVDTLEGIDGDITRDSVNKALIGLDTYESDLIGWPYGFGADGSLTDRTVGTKIVQLKGAQWQVISTDWEEVPS